jgi:hypothetical protein
VRQHDLRRHEKIHGGDKPFVCACKKSFARQDALTRHRQRYFIPFINYANRKGYLCRCVCRVKSCESSPGFSKTASKEE